MAEKIGNLRRISKQIEQVQNFKLDIRNSDLAKLMSAKELQEGKAREYKYGNKGGSHEVTARTFKQLQRSTTKAIKQSNRKWTPRVLFNRMQSGPSLDSKGNRLQPRRARMYAQIFGASIVGFKKNVALFKVTKSQASKHPFGFHQVKVRFEAWDQAVSLPEGTYKQKVLWLIQQPISVDCTCEDYQFRLRYWNSKKGFSITHESAPPKITNPGDEKGSLCIHTGRVVRSLLDKKPRIIQYLAKELKRHTEGKSSTVAAEKYIDEKSWKLKEKYKGAAKKISKIAKIAHSQTKKPKTAREKAHKNRLRKATIKEVKRLNAKVKSLEKTKNADKRKINSLEKSYKNTLQKNLKMVLQFAAEGNRDNALKMFAKQNNLPLTEVTQMARGS